MKNIARLKKNLEKIYNRLNRRSLINPDPLQFVYRYKKRNDKEIVAFLSASLAYGRVAQIENSLNKLLGIMGKSPYEFIINFSRIEKLKLDDFRHRFTSGHNIGELFRLLKTVYRQGETIEDFFASGYNPADENIIAALDKFCGRLLEMHEKKYNLPLSRGLKYLLTRPANNSPCKRLNLFLRWMIRSDDVDTGLWKSVDKSKLVIPADTHIGRIGAILGFHNDKNITLKTAVKITAGFAEISPGDPVKYDFALCRLSMLGLCKSGEDIENYAASI